MYIDNGVKIYLACGFVLVNLESLMWLACASWRLQFECKIVCILDGFPFGGEVRLINH